MGFPVSEQSITGVKDDGSAEGIIRTKISQGELIKVPFIRSMFNNNGNSGSAGMGLAIGTYQNVDGSCSGLGSNSGTPGLGVNIGVGNTWFYGTTLGIRGEVASTTPNHLNRFSVVIDGMPYDCIGYKTQTVNDNSSGSSFVQNETIWMIAENLKKGKHSLQIINFPDPVYTKIFGFFGLLVDKSSGNIQRKSIDFMYGDGSLTTSALNIPDTHISSSDAQSYNAVGVKAVLYTNTDTVARIVTIKMNTRVIFTIPLTAAGTLGSSYRFLLSENGVTTIGLTGNLQHYADAVSVINFICIGGS